MTKKEFIEWLEENDFYDDLNKGFFNENLVDCGLQINIPTEKSYVDYYRSENTYDSFAANYISAVLNYAKFALIDGYGSVDIDCYKKVTNRINDCLDLLKKMIEELEKDDKLIQDVWHDEDNKEYIDFEDEE